uniref:Viral A-type inclusion protein n=1 Tax=Parastrongyloides trichosuri TaxID=131310 RepID=A0A0N5A7E9_PARTI
MDTFSVKSYHGCSQEENKRFVQRYSKQCKNEKSSEDSFEFQKIMELNKKIRELRNEIFCQKENIRLKDKIIDELYSDIRKNSNDKEIQEKEITSLKNVIAEFETKKNEQTDVDKLNKRIEDLEKRVQNQRTHLNTSATAISESKSKIVQLREDVKKQTMENKSKDNEIKDLLKENKHLKNEISMQIMKLVDEIKKITESDRNIQILEEKIENLTKENQLLKETSPNQQENVEDIDNLSNQLSVIKAKDDKIEELMERVEKQQSVIILKDQRINELSSKLAAYYNKYECQDKKNDDIQEQSKNNFNFDNMKGYIERNKRSDGSIFIEYNKIKEFLNFYSTHPEECGGSGSKLMIIPKKPSVKTSNHLNEKFRNTCISRDKYKTKQNSLISKE